MHNCLSDEPPGKPKPSPAEGDLLFDLDPEPLEECLTAFAGIPLFVQAMRSLNIGTTVKQHVQLKQRQRGFDEATYVESFLVLNALGGDCLEDFDRLREDAGLKQMLGHEVPSPEAARKFLYQFHDEQEMERAQAELPVGQVSYIPAESAALRGLAQVNGDLVREIGRRCPDQRIATIDLDATVIESFKREARRTYEGTTGYQPMLALWAEMDLAVADEFRDGNVPATKALLPVTQRAFQALPDSVKEFYFRGDSGCWERTLVNWLRDENRTEGPQGRITFAISVRMTPSLKQHIGRVTESLWKPYREDADIGERVCRSVELLAGGRRPAGRCRATALCRHSRPETAGGSVCRWSGRETFCGGDKRVGLEQQEAAGMASGKSRLDRSAAPCAEERIGSRSDAMWPIWRQCGLAAFCGAHT